MTAQLRRKLERTLQRPHGSDAGFTLVEMLIALVLSGIIAGVTVAAMITSMNAVTSTTAQVSDSTDAGLISAYLFRDAQAAGGIDPTTAVAAQGTGVVSATSAASNPSGDQWVGCSQTGTLVVRFSWLRRAVGQPVGAVVATYALDAQQQLIRRVCENGSSVDVLLGKAIGTVVAACAPDPSCGTATESVSLTVVGTGVRSPYRYTLTASLRTGQQPRATVANSAPAPLLVLGTAPSTAPCPSLSLRGTGTIKVQGDAVVGDACGSAPIGGDQTRLQPTGSSTILPGLTDPFAATPATPATCDGSPNPAPLGASTGPNQVVVYPQLVTVTGNVTMQPGRYVFCNGFTVVDGATLAGAGLFLDVVGGAVTVASQAEIRLAAAATGDRANLLLRMGSTQPVHLAQSARPGVIAGVIDAPNSAVDLSGTAPISIGGLVARTVDIGGANPLRFGIPVPTITITSSSLPAAQVASAYPATSLAASGGTSPYTWTATGLPAGLSLSASGDLTGTPTNAGDVTVVILLLDATNTATQATLPLQVRAAPTVTAPASFAAGESGVAYAGGPTPLVASATGGSPPFTWSATGLPTGVSISPSGMIGGTPTVAGSFVVDLRATDAIGAAAARSYTFVVRDAIVISGPATLPNGTEASAYPDTTIIATGGTAPYTWSAVGLPAGLSINGFGVVTGTLSTSGSYNVTIGVTDAGGATAAKPYSLVIAGTGGNPMAPAQRFQLLVENNATVGTFGLAGSVAVGGNLVFKNYQTIASGETSTFSAATANLPAGLVVGGYMDLPTSGSGNQLTLGSGDAHVGSLNGANLLTFGTNVHVASAGVSDNWQTPRLIVQADQSNQSTDPVVQPSAFPFGTTFAVLRASSTAIAALDPATCSAIAAPTVTAASGNYTLTLVAGKVNVWNVTLQQITMMSNVAAPTNPDAATPLVINVTDAGTVDIPPRYWSPLQNGAPSAILWNFPNATAVGVGTTFVGTVFAPRAAVTITNVQIKGDIVASSLSLLQGDGTVAHFTTPIPCTANSLAVTQPAGLPNGEVGIAYPSTQLVAQGGLAPYTWAASSLPAGLVLGTDGILSGTPTTAGSVFATVTVTDAAMTAVPRTYALTVVTGPSVSSPASLPVGEAGAAYSSTIAAVGGTTPYTWSATGLPNGLTIGQSGVIAGTPASAGSATVRVTVTDVYGATAFRQFGLTVGTASCTPEGSNWAGQYYANATLSGTPAFCRQDADVNFNWGTGSPGTGVGVDDFSVRWTRTAQFSAGTYNFSKGSDDGWRMYVDGVLALDDWNDQSYANGMEVLSEVMTAGQHTIVAEYYERGGQAQATLSWVLVPAVVCPTSPSGWVGRYYRGRDLAGGPVLCRDDASLDFDWGAGSPDAGVPSDDFSARWTRTITTVAGTYRFTAGSDDGVRVYIDGALQIDHWSDHSYATDVVNVPLAAGGHTVVMEFYERGGSARAGLVWQQVTSATCPSPVAGWTGQYYQGRALDGGVVVCRDDAAINVNWGSGSPATELPVDDFSVRWTKTVTFAAGTYTFIAGSDDGIRVSIDGVLLINAWADRSYATTSATTTLGAGAHTIVVEFYERGGSARATFTWS